MGRVLTAAAEEPLQARGDTETEFVRNLREHELVLNREHILTRDERLAYVFAAWLVGAIVCLARYRYPVAWPTAWGAVSYRLFLLGVLAWMALATTYLWSRMRGEVGILAAQSLVVMALLPPVGAPLPFGLLMSAFIIIRAMIRLSRFDVLVFLALFWAVYSMDMVATHLTEAPDSLLSYQLLQTGAMAILAHWVALMYRWHLNRCVEDSERLRRAHAVASELFDANIRLQDRVDQATALATRQERLSLARELHDTVAYTFTTIAAGIETGAELIRRDPDAAASELAYARKLTSEGLREVREIVRTLREKAERGFHGPERWRALATVFREATGVTVTLEIPADFPPVVEELDEVVYRLIQEGMINAYRHGRATVIWVRVWLERGHLCVLVSDNGCGAKELGAGFGLLGMQERVHAFGGRLSWRTSPGAGFDLAVEIPLQERGKGDRDPGAAG